MARYPQTQEHACFLKRGNDLSLRLGSEVHDEFGIHNDGPGFILFFCLLLFFLYGVPDDGA